MTRKINEKNPTGNLTRWPAGLNQERQRTRRADPDAFVNGAEKQTLDTAEETRKLSPEARTRIRARGKKYNLYSLRGTEQQQQLLQYAAEQEGTSIQKLLASLAFPILEEKYGADLPLNNI